MVKINYKIEGVGKVIVFIHGLSDNLHYWDALSNNLKDDYKIIRFDLRGHGESDLGEEDISIESYADDLDEILEKFNISQVNIIGFSLGGAVALTYALKYPQKVSFLILMSSFYKSDSYLTGVFKDFRNALNNSFEDYFDLILPMIYCPNFIKENQEEFLMIKEYASQISDCNALIKAIDASLLFNLEDNLDEISIPTLVLMGKYDEISLLSMQERLSEKISNSKVILFGNVKHNLLIDDNLKEIVDIIVNFI